MLQIMRSRQNCHLKWRLKSRGEGVKVSLRATADIRHSHSRTARYSRSTQILWNLPHVRAQSYSAKRYLAMERPQVTRVQRIGPVLFQDSFASPTGCRLSTVARVCEVLWQATATLMSWRLWCGFGVTQVCGYP